MLNGRAFAMGEPLYARRPTASCRFVSILVAVKASNRLPQPWRTVVDWVVTIVLAVVFVLAFEAEVAKPYRIPSSSMEPTLHCAKPGAWCEGTYNDRVIANRLAFRFSDPEARPDHRLQDAAQGGAVRPGDGGATFVKRLIGLPGDLRLRAQRAGLRATARSSASRTSIRRSGRETGAWPRVAPGHYFFLGDDRTHSCDSRTWGTVPHSSLIGPVIATYWPPNRIDWFG